MTGVGFLAWFGFYQPNDVAVSLSPDGASATYLFQRRLFSSLQPGMSRVIIIPPIW
jgi:hypothetical protein